jgi:uncharacterized protein YndB with AHSA1/START domain
MDLVPGGALVTEISEDGGKTYGPHMNACFLEIEEGNRIVYTTCLVAGWRPAPNPFVTGIVSFADHPDGTAYAARALHASKALRNKHEELGFLDGWGTVVAQLAKFVE